MYPLSVARTFVAVALIAAVFSPASGMNCYQCSSTDHDHPFQCNEFMPDDTDLQATSCDAVHGAQYCVKLVGRNGVSGWWFRSGPIKCYQCSSHNNLDCAENAIHDGISDGSMEPTECSHVDDPKYCIKYTGRPAGVLSTIRQCSSLDLGNYCNYVRNVGDVMDYRSCVYTCSSDGCNSAPGLNSLTKSLMLLGLFVVLGQGLFIFS